MKSARVEPGSASTPTPTPRRFDASSTRAPSGWLSPTTSLGPLPDEDQDDWPAGHREGNRAGDDDVREAGENR